MTEVGAALRALRHRRRELPAFLADEIAPGDSGAERA